MTGNTSANRPDTAEVEAIDGLLNQLEKCGHIEVYARCLGTPSFDIELLSGDWIQIIVRDDEWAWKGTPKGSCNEAKGES